jgi:hypothetical protein
MLQNIKPFRIVEKKACRNPPINDLPKLENGLV